MTEKHAKKKAIEVQKSIRHILFYDWDPIGVNDLAPDDEYDSYVADIYRLLISGASRTEIAAHLRQIEITWMSSVTDREHRDNIAEKLINLKVSRLCTKSA